MKLPRFASLSVVAAMTALASLFALAPPGETHAHEPGGEADYVDVALILEVPVDESARLFRDLNIIVVNNGARTAYDVEVVVEIVYPKDESRFDSGNPIISVPVGSVSLENGERTFRWAIPALGGLQREEVTLEVWHKERPLNAAFDKSLYVHEHSGKVTTSSFESEFRKGNNASRVWSHNYSVGNGRHRQAAGNYLVNVSVSEQSPSPGDTVDFTITADRENPYTNPVGLGPPPIDLKVAIELTGGLSVSGDPSYASGPVGTSPPVPASVIYSHGVFNVGTLRAQEPTRNSVTVPIRVADNAVVHEQCLTATLTGNPPPGTGPLDDDISDNVAKICLGTPPPPPGDVVVFDTGRIDMPTWYDCSQTTVHPCDDTVSLELVALGGEEAGYADGSIFHPDKVVVHIPDPVGRRMSSASGSDDIVWSTGFEDPGPGDDQPGVRMRNNRSLPDIETTNDPDRWGRPDPDFPDFQILDLKVEVAGPGEMATWYRDGNDAVNFYNAGTNEVVWDSFSDLGYDLDFWAEFSTLGTYTMKQTISTEYDNDTTDTTAGIAVTESETYTFHVGPMTELEVRAGGASPHADVGQYTLTVEALNNGPDSAPDAEVTIDLSSLPAGVSVASHVASKGSYANGTWDLGTLDAEAEAATLTLILRGGNAASAAARASISNVEDYTVCIASDASTLAHATRAACEAATGASWHEGTVYDYKPRNNSVTVMARASLAGTAPDTRPGMVAVTPMDGANMVTWSEPQSGNDHRHFGPVRSWDIDYSDDGGSGWTPLQHRFNGFFGLNFYVDRDAPADRRYRVRARYDERVGDWTEQGEIVAQVAAAGDPGVTISPTDLTVREGSRGSYRVRLDARPTGEVVIDVANANPDVRLSAERLTFTPSNWNRAQTVSVTVARDSDTADDTDTITHVIDRDATSALEYRDLAADDVTVTVDDRDTAARFTVGRSGTTAIGVDEGGSTEYELALGTRPTEDVRVSLSYTSGIIEVSPSNLTFTPDNYNVPQTITVTGVQDDDAVDNDLGFILHSFSGGYADDAWLNVTVTDDDRAGVGGEVELALSRGSCPGTWPESLTGAQIAVTGWPEEAGGCFYSLRLNAAPTGNVTVTVRTDASKVELDTDIFTDAKETRLTFTQENWRDAQEIRFETVWDADGVNNNDFTIRHSISGGGLSGVTIPDIAVSVVDHDRDRIGFRVDTPHWGLVAKEGGSCTWNEDLYDAAFYMYPGTQPMSTVTVVMSSDNPDVTLSPSRLSFTRSNWDRGAYEGSPGRRVTVCAAQDSDEDHETATITFTVTSSDAHYNGKEIGPLTVRVTDDDAEEEQDDPPKKGEAAPPPEQGDDASVPTFVIYHDPDAGAESVDRYNEAVALLADAGLQAVTVKGDVGDDVDRLAGVTDSVLPRFFLGDPTDEDWTSEPGENNGGLRWLREKVAELSED